MLTTTSFSSNSTPDNSDMMGGYVYPSGAGARAASLAFYGLVIPAKVADAHADRLLGRMAAPSGSHGR